MTARTVILTIVLVTGVRSTWAEPTTVAVDVTKLDKATYDRIDALNLEKKVVVRLVQEGFAVMAASENPHVRVEYTADDDLHITVTADSTRRERDVALTPGGEHDSLHLEVAQKTVELVRQMPPPTNDVKVSVTPKAERLSSETPDAPYRPTVVLNAVAGAVMRGDADAYLGVGGGYWFRPKFAAIGTLALVPASSDDIGVFEWQAQAGLSWRPLHTDTWQLTLGASAGVLVHHFSRQGDSGTRTDLLLTLPVTALRNLSEQLALGLRLAPGFADESREHIQADAQLWERSSARIETALFLQWQP